jgi:DNA primase
VRFDERFLEEIKSRVRLSDVIGKTVKLKRQGREYAGLSPFTKEKSPSFFVNDDKGFWHDFSSGKHGDLIGFLQETERLSFPEAVERVAAEAGVPLPAVDPRSAAIEEKRQSLQEWLELAAKWFEASLRRPAGREARAYLEARGLPEDQWSQFRLGFAPADRTSLKDALVQRGAMPAELVEAGLLISPEGGGQPYDRFRERIIFPITDQRGRVMSFGGRAMNPDTRAKYLNGPETSLFHKGQVVYGLQEARRLLGIGDEPPLVVVEGYMDVIACQRAGVAAVAPMGTALTEEQMELLWRLHPEPTLCFDSDQAGIRASHRVIDRALPLLKPGRSFRFASITGGKDPDDVLREQGPAALRAQLEKTRPFSEKLFERELTAVPVTTPEQRAGLKVRLRQVSRAIADGDLSEQYRIDLLGKFDVTFPRIQYVPGWKKRKGTEYLAGLLIKDAAERLRDRIKRLNAAVAMLACENPNWLLPYVEEFSAFGFGDDRLLKLKQPLMETICGDEVTAKIAAAIIREAKALETYAHAIRIARETPNFILAEKNLPPGRLMTLWSRAFEGIIELETILQMTGNRSPDSLVSEMAERLRWRQRRTLLERQLSDLTIFDD